MKFIGITILLLSFSQFSNASERLINKNVNFTLASLQDNISTKSQKQLFPEKFIQTAGTCFLEGERTSGMNKICYYSCVSGEVAITIKAYKLCPLTIKN